MKNFRFLFIYVDDFKDALRCQLERMGTLPGEREFDVLCQQAKSLFGHNQPIAGNPRLGILTLASVLREHFGERVVVDQVDMGLECWSANDLRWKLREFQPDYVGLSCMLPFAHIFHEVTAVTKKILPKVKVLAGGPYISSAPEKVLADPNVDLIALNEAEETLPELLEVWESQGEISKVKGIAYRDQEMIVFSDSRPLVQDLNLLPRPAVDLIDITAYSKAYRIVPSQRKAMPLFSSRGCPYECTFCHNLSGKTVRWRSADNVFTEIEYYYHHYGVREFYFWDDIFNLNIKRAHELCDLILKNRLELRFAFPRGMRGDILNKDLIDHMVEAGLFMTSFAIESASPRIQKMIKKYNNFEKIAENIRYCVEKGVLVNTFNMLDFPTETAAEMRQTMEFNLSLPHQEIQLFKVTPFQGTHLFDQVGGYDHFENLGAGTFYKYRKKMLSEVSPEFFQDLIQEFTAKFYFSEKRQKLNRHFQSKNISSEELNSYFTELYSKVGMQSGSGNIKRESPLPGHDRHFENSPVEKSFDLERCVSVPAGSIQ